MGEKNIKMKIKFYFIFIGSSSFEINKLCWDFFYQIYGGGPVLIKKCINKTYNAKMPTQTVIPTASVIKTLSKSILLSSSPTTTSSFSLTNGLSTSKSLLYRNGTDGDDNNAQLPINHITSQNIINIDSNENMFQIKHTKI